jgi:hypothetical protein
VNYPVLKGGASSVGWFRACSQAAPCKGIYPRHLSNFFAMLMAPFRSALYSPQWRQTKHTPYPEALFSFESAQQYPLEQSASWQKYIRIRRFKVYRDSSPPSRTGPLAGFKE